MMEQITCAVCGCLSSRGHMPRHTKTKKCINNKEIENHILEDRIEGTKKYKVNATPTLIINEKKFDKSLTYKNLKKIIEKNL